MDYGALELTAVELSALVGIFVSAGVAHAFIGG
jgi:hypothetical protein